MAIKKIGVLGAGLMGAGIAQVAATSGYEVTVVEVSEELIKKGLGGIEKSLAKFVEKRTTRQRGDAGTAKIARKVAAPREKSATPRDRSEHYYKVERYALKPMSAQEAVAELKLAGGDVLIFVNQSGVVNAVVRRGTRVTLYEPEGTA